MLQEEIRQFYWQAVYHDTATEALVVVLIQSPADIENQTQQQVSPYIVGRMFQRLVCNDYKTVYKGPDWKPCFCSRERGTYNDTP